MFRLNLLGTVDLIGADGAALDASLRRSKRLMVLAYLVAARPRGFHRREKIAALFWPELPGDRARAALRTTLSRLREEYNPALILVRGADEIAVDATMLSCDVIAFDDAIAARRFADAAALYRGPLLDAVHVEGTGEELEHWIESERARILAATIQALCTAAADAERQGALDVATAAAQRAVHLAPTNEIAARQLIALALAAGNRGSAMQIYDDLARRLQSEFDVEPSPETHAALQIDRTDTPRAAQGPRVVPSPGDVRVAAPPTVPAAARALSEFIRRPTTRRTHVTWGVIAAGITVAAAWAVTRIGATGPQPAASEMSPANQVWHRMAVSTERSPTPRVHDAVMLDSTNDALIVIGGIVALGEGPDASPVMGDIWRLTGLSVEAGHRWTPLRPAPGPTPGPRWASAFAYDRAHDRALLIAGARGHTSPCTNDAWILDQASGVGGPPRWREVRASGPRPSTRAMAQGAYDARSRTFILFGGNDCFSTYMADVWTLTFDDSTMGTGRWTQLAPDSSAGAPMRRNGAGVAYDAQAGRLWVQGGNLGGSQELAELWRLDHADGRNGAPSWHPVHCAGTAPAIGGQVIAYDTTSGALLLFSGSDDAGRPRNDLWFARALSDGGSHCAWEHVAATGDAPLPRQTARGVLLPGNHSLVLLGGMVESMAMLDLWRLEWPFR